MYWRSKGINILPQLDDFLFLIFWGYDARTRLSRIIEEDMRRAGLSINWDKRDRSRLQERVHLGFVVKISEGLFLNPCR